MAWSDVSETIAILQVSCVNQFLPSAYVIELISTKKFFLLLKENGIVTLWTKTDPNPYSVNSQVQGATFLMWRNDLILCGTSKGNIALIDSVRGGVTTIVGKHTSPILSGVWLNHESEDNVVKPLLVLGAADRMLSVSNLDGDTIDQIELDDVPMSLSVYQETFLSVNKGGKSLCLYSLLEKKSLFDENMNLKHGDIVFQGFLHDGNILVGCKKGSLLIVSNELDASKRIMSIQKLPFSSLEDVKYCKTKHMIATWGKY